MIQYQLGSVVDTSVVEMKSAGSASERCKYGGLFFVLKILLCGT
jgi:hypothetical protein